MKLFHLSDLHIGRRIGEISLYEDQKYIIDQILAYAETELPDGVLIAGDVYDKSIPSVDAVDLLDYFITELISRRLPVFMVSGNHDSPQRLNFGSRILDKSGIHIAGVFDGKPVKKTLADDFGEVDIYMLPYLKPALVRPHFSNEIVTYEDALRTVIDSIGIDINRRNILVAHQFVTSG
ncbi:MAG: exonuclease subunit SbcD, partial [Clostridiales bacterium]|nr:exonuclease subunit SbcD [Clostridiales bacterium]